MLSYSGDTEETLACFAAAEAVGARRYAATTGGALADAAREAGVPVVGLPGGPAAASLGRLRVHGRVRDRGARRRRRPACAPRSTPPPHTWRPIATRWSPGGEIAEQLAGTVPLIYGCELTVPVAYRWKCQVNENAKQHAFDHELPELDHNEIVGWTATLERWPALLRRLPRRLATSTPASASAPS